ncbi:LacI family DNA-binding transcriptional regulator [Paraurantiacibacter namhicola]|uniref:HTH-type transcriptional regulator DegA n=1 Tax=Paraurantiacibacter namhicola TaxID=645517 RepID=A0A1C7D6H8_9SPHN|nr:LacI family DNA-binding transcriptional regulator [Paraurantiacibacter namhicola]ANU07060.1 HTH-type transcriptional regulator DegA [Paraurantiacibacter namhicola]
MADKRPSATPAVRTITDLAKIAGVSAGTVSRALSGNSLVNTKTRERIETIAREHGFRPNQMASRLRRQKTGVIGIIIPLGHEQKQQVSDTFFLTLLGHLADALTERGYDLMLRRVVPASDEDWLDPFIGSGMIDGVIVVGQSDQFDHLEDVADGYRPMVVWGQHREGQRHCVVGSDNLLGGKLAAEKLIASGAKKLAFVGDTNAPEFAARFSGARQVAASFGIDLTELPAHLATSGMTTEVAGLMREAVRKFDGIFAATDLLALACLGELRKLNHVVPDDIKLVGFDDLPIAQQTVPPLTTVRQDIAGGARAMVDLLVRRISGEDTESIVMPPKLVVRGTT